MGGYEFDLWVFMLSAFLGFQLIRSVSPLLHTPLMSLTNAISAITVVGAILLTGYLGGAVAVQVRVGHPMFSETLFPLYVAALVWGGLYLRERRLRALVPARN